MTRVLYIDNEPLNHQLVDHALQPLGSKISFAEDGTSGLPKREL
jgi:CheY-like chemotaxis protein